MKHAGVVETGAQALMPLLEHVFKMPTTTSGSTMTRGSDKWIQAVIKTGRFSYVDCVEFKALMDAYVKSLLKGAQKAGNRNGYPARKAEEDIPMTNKLYNLNPNRKFRPRATTHQKELPFLRASSFQAAVLGCKNACLYPVKVCQAAISNALKNTRPTSFVRVNDDYIYVASILAYIA